ncbi:30S ribosomal protein S17 [bacterium]|jgi:small subunit ribosomal protein S17|nr:30S ribosomal protein S17 [bacterium]
MTTTKQQRTLTGVVTKISGKNTIRITVSERAVHPVYDKVVKRSRSFLVHDNESVANEGDKVEVISVRPISKLKSWKLVRVVEKGKTIESGSK